jgi:hypothetical protein
MRIQGERRSPQGIALIDLTLNPYRHGGTSAVMKLVKLFAESVSVVFFCLSGTHVHWLAEHRGRRRFI